MAKADARGCLYVAACAGGILNGLTSKMTTYRTSHVTGTVTDVGLLLGKGLGETLEDDWRGDPRVLDGPSFLKLKDLLILMSAWLIGGCSGFWLGNVIGVGKVMALASCLVVSIGLKAFSLPMEVLGLLSGLTYLYFSVI